jgi:hypothetical protein
MVMSDDFERQLRDQLEREARQVSRFPGPLRARILDAIEPRRRLGLTQQLALAGALVLFVALLAVGVAQLRLLKGGVEPATTPTPSASIVPSASAAPTPSVQATASALSFTCAAGSGGGASISNLTDLRVAHHPGYDRITFQFDGALPAYDITPQPNSQFVEDPRGGTVTLQGSSGLRIVFHGGSDYSTSGQQTYTGSTDVKPNLPSVKEVRQMGDFERVLSWGVGIAGSPCYHVLELSGPTRLVIDVQAS